MKINIYYGGRGLLDDPTLYVISKMEDVLRELRVKVERYNIYERKNEIATLPQTIKDADGIILATTVEWLGIGGYMQQFLDACWLYGDKEKISEKIDFFFLFFLIWCIIILLEIKYIIVIKEEYYEIIQYT